MTRSQDDTITDVVEQCQQERQQLRAAAHPHPCDQNQRVYPPSPWCIRLFRMAFDGNQEAWNVIYGLWRKQMHKWAGCMMQALIGRGLEVQDIEDVVQDGWREFMHYAPNRPGLLATDDLSPVLSYLRECAKTSALRHKRKREKQRRGEKAFLDEQAETQQENVPEQIAAGETRREIWDILLSHARTEDEQIVLLLYFHNGLKPQEIMKQHLSWFPNTSVIETIVLRLKRRFRGDQRLKDLFNGEENEE